MCFPADAKPPIDSNDMPVWIGDLTLSAADGAEFAAFVARAEQPNGVGVVVLPDVRGLFHFYEELAVRFAEQGMVSVAIDYFGRTAGVAKRGEEFPFMEHVAQTKADQIAQDVGAAVAYLRSAEGGNCESIFTVGFCFGGSNSWLQAASGHDLAGVIGFYGRPGPGREGSPGPMDRVGEFACPVMALMGGADQGIPVEQVNAFEQALMESDVEHEVIIYPGAPHSFFDRSFEQHADASADAWAAVLGFIGRYQRAGAAAD